MIIRSRAPLRISFAGGGTDVSPYFEERGGAVLSATIDKYAHCHLSRGTDGTVSIRSLDYGSTVRYNSTSGPPTSTELSLLTSTLKRFQLNDGIEMVVRSDSLPGSGLGSSSAMAVAAVGAAWRVSGLKEDLDAIAKTAFLIEREDAGIPGGKQDQYAAAYGGLNFIEFHKEKTSVQRLKVPDRVLDRLQSRLLLCDTGNRRPSANIINDQVDGYKSRSKEVVEALDSTKELAYKMKTTLLAGHLDNFGRLLNEAWTAKRRFSTRVSNPQIDLMYERAMQSGAIGGKLLGAGAGGFMIFFCSGSNYAAVATELARLGGKVIRFSLVNEGLTTQLLAGNGGS